MPKYKFLNENMQSNITPKKIEAEYSALIEIQNDNLPDLKQIKEILPETCGIKESEKKKLLIECEISIKKKLNKNLDKISVIKNVQDQFQSYVDEIQYVIKNLSEKKIF